MIDHIGFPVSDLTRSRTFCQRALAPLGFAVQMEITPEKTGGYEDVGVGLPMRPLFCSGSGEALRAETPAGTDGTKQRLRFACRANAALDYREGE